MFLATLIETLIKMVIIGAAAFGGIMLGKYLRKKKDEQDEQYYESIWSYRTEKNVS